MTMVDSEFKRKILEIKALRMDFNRGMRAFQLRLDALGARWGIFAEEAFREGACGRRGEIEHKQGRCLYSLTEGQTI